MARPQRRAALALALAWAAFSRAAHAQPAEPLPPPPPPPPADSSNAPPPSAPSPRPRGAPPPRPHPAPPAPAPREPTPAPAPPAPAPAPAPEPTYDPADWGDRTMGGHTFLIPAVQDTAFVLTTAGLRSGFAWTSIPNFPAGNAGRTTLTLSGVTENAELGVRLVDWLALTAELGAFVMTGTNVRSLVDYGGEHLYGGGIGLAAKIARFEKTHTQLGAHLKVHLDSGRLITERAFVDSGPGSANEAVQGPSGNLLLTPETVTRFAGTINVAQGINRTFALQAQLGLAFAAASLTPYDLARRTTFDQSISTTLPTITLGLEADGASSHVPFAGMLEYQIGFAHTKDDTSGTSASRTQHVLALGGYYVARPNLQVGLVASAQLGLEPVTGVSPGGGTATSDKPTIYAIEAVFRYVF